MTCSSFGTLTATTKTDTAPADGIEAPTNDDSEEEAADGTAGADGLLRATADGGGGLLVCLHPRWRASDRLLQALRCWGRGPSLQTHGFHNYQI